MDGTSSGAFIERMGLQQRLEHGLLAVSIALLMLSGGALAYHDQPWARLLIRLAGGMEGRLVVHRTAAVGLIAAVLLHIFGLVFNRGHQRDLRRLFPKARDFSEALKGFRFRWTGKGESARYEWFTLMEKLQYWGVGLVCLLMCLSGAVLWSPQASMLLFPKWFFDLMFVMHSEEAQILALLFVVWHLYDVHLAGGNFPMNPAWLTGKMRSDIFRSRHQETDGAPASEEGL